MLPNCIDGAHDRGNIMVNLFVNGITRMVNFLGELPRFRQLTTSDQKVLLQNGASPRNGRRARRRRACSVLAQRDAVGCPLCLMQYCAMGDCTPTLR